MTSLVVDPTDPDVIYIATAGGGAWKTQDGGQSWQPLFDSAFAGANPAVMFGGTIAPTVKIREWKFTGKS